MKNIELKYIEINLFEKEVYQYYSRKKKENHLN